MSFCWSKIRPEEALRPIAVAKVEPFALAPVVFKKEESMADQDERNAQKSEMRVMWIMTTVIVLIILGLMGFNMLTHPDWMHGL